MLVADDSPVWTRAYGREAVDCTALDSVLAKLGAKRMVVAHTVQDHGITSGCDGKLWRIDVGLASVYRVLEQLSKDGFVQRIDLGAGISRFEPIHSSGEHHHHLVCDDCGKVEAFADAELERALRRVEGRTGFSVAGHDVVLHGQCPDCQDASRPGRRR